MPRPGGVGVCCAVFVRMVDVSFSGVGLTFCGCRASWCSLGLVIQVSVQIVCCGTFLQSDHAMLAVAERIIRSLGFTNQEEIPEDYNLGKRSFLFLSNPLLTSAKVLVFPWIVWTVVLCVVLMVSILTSRSSENSSSF